MKLTTKNNQDLSVDSAHLIAETMSRVLDMAKQLGATDAAVEFNKEQGFSLDVRMKEVETLSFHEDKSIHITIYIHHKKGSAVSTDSSENALRKAVTAAYEIAKISEEDIYFGLPEKSLYDNSYPELDLFHPWDMTPEKAIETLIAFETQALNEDKRITNSDGASLATFTSMSGYANTQGFSGLIHGSMHSISASLIASDGKNMQRDYDYICQRNPSKLTSLESLAKSTARKTVARLGAKKIKTQKSPVIFAPQVAKTLFSHFIQAISGSQLYRKNSFLLDACGQQVFSSCVTVYEQPHIKQGLGSHPFDAEGILTKNNIFAKEGVLNQYVLSHYTAKRLGLHTTGNAGGVFNLTVSPTAKGLDDLLAQMNTGLLITELMGQGVNILTGDYSRGASGFWIENGNIMYPVEEITIAGNLKNIFQSIVAIGNDWNINSSTQCGSVLISEMMIAGS